MSELNTWKENISTSIANQAIMVLLNSESAVELFYKPGTSTRRGMLALGKYKCDNQTLVDLGYISANPEIVSSKIQGNDAIFDHSMTMIDIKTLLKECIDNLPLSQIVLPLQA